MTVGVGFLCSDGVVLCADRQVTSTSGFKHEARKISAHHNQSYTAIFTYAGIEDEGEIMFRKVYEAIDRGGLSDYSHLTVRPILERVFKDGFESDYTQGFESLIGFNFRRNPSWLFKTWDRRVVDGGAEYIGCGDSSALRYLCDFLLTGRMMNIDQASVLGSYYIASVANRYVDSCSGGPDRAVIHPNGSLSEGAGGPFPNTRERFFHCEEQIGNALREMLLSGGTKRVIVEDISKN